MKGQNPMRSLILLLSLIFIPVHAETVDIEKLPPAIQMQIKTSSVREEVEAWSILGANVGKAMVGAAKEIGVAATDFAETPLGILVCGIIVWKLLGTTIVCLIVAIVVPLVGFYIARRIEEYAYEKGDPVVVKHLWGLYSTVQCPRSAVYDNDYLVVAAIVRCLTGVAVIIILGVAAANI